MHLVWWIPSTKPCNNWHLTLGESFPGLQRFKLSWYSTFDHGYFGCSSLLDEETEAKSHEVAHLKPPNSQVAKLGFGSRALTLLLPGKSKRRQTAGLWSVLKECPGHWWQALVTTPLLRFSAALVRYHLYSSKCSWKSSHLLRGRT